MSIIVHTDKGEVEIEDNERTKCEVWSRVMGYYRPIEGWNIGKKQEYKDRKFYSESVATDVIEKMNKSQNTA
jgi:hypothetical protein